MLYRIYWMLFGRYLTRLSNHNFSAHWNTYASLDSKFGINIKLASKTFINKSTIGSYTYIQGARCSRVDIGNFCSVGPEVLIGGLGVHPTDLLSTSPVFYSTRNQCGASFSKKTAIDELPRTTVGNDVWIGARAMILDGVNVSDGAIIAANAVVTKDVPPYAIVGGVPAKIIRFRFSDDVIEALLQYKWWNLTEHDLLKVSQFFIEKRLWRANDIQKIKDVTDHD